VDLAKNASFKEFWRHLLVTAAFLAREQALDGQKRQQ
jgi:hypothetical protein